MNPQDRQRAITEARGLTDRKLERVLAAGPDGIEPQAWQALVGERELRERLAQDRADEASRPVWGAIGFRKSVELGMGIAVGFLLVSLGVGLIVGLIRLAMS